jgi:hypothetical protein
MKQSPDCHDRRGVDADSTTGGFLIKRLQHVSQVVEGGESVMSTTKLDESFQIPFATANTADIRRSMPMYV